MKAMRSQYLQEFNPRETLFQIVVKAAFIAVVSFGAPAGVLAAVAPRFFFGLTEGITCSAGTRMIYSEWNDGESTQFRVGCADPAGELVKDRTLMALVVLLGMWFLAIFYIALIVMLILRAARKNGQPG